MITRKFKCTQQELYPVCRLAWSTCNDYIDQFNTIKNKYTAEFILERYEEIKRVSEMNDFIQRRANRTMMRYMLRDSHSIALKNFNTLKCLIAEAWPKEELKIQFKSAGQPFYKDACNYKWEVVVGMLQNANTFIIENKEQLLSNNNMKEDFALNFEKIMNDYSKHYFAYIETKSNSPIDTNDLLAAQNKLYEDVISMFQDSRILFPKNDSHYKFFVFENVLRMVSGNNMAGLKGRVSNGIRPRVEIPDVLITIKELGETTGCNEDGNYIFSPLAAGFYTLEVEAPGYKSQTIPNVEIKTSILSKMDIVLEHL